MKFSDMPVASCVGAILAHGVAFQEGRLKKGHVLTEADRRALERAGVDRVTAVTLDAGDEPEDAAAARLAAALGVAGITIGDAATGRVNLFAAQNGLFRVERAAVDAVNRVDPAITLACLGDHTQVRAGEMVATIKIIPLAVQGVAVGEACALLSAPGLFQVKPFTAMTVGLVATELPGLKKSVMDKTRDLLAQRLAPSASRLIREVRTGHEAAAVGDAIKSLKTDCDMIVVFGASAVADPEDVIPEAIRLAGGHVEAVGMPVDPGNLLVLGFIEGKAVIGAPGCARSPKENGFDWVLTRLLAGETVTRDVISAMGVGGLLTEIPSRPQPRNIRVTPAQAIRVEAVLLAAGRSSRMGAAGGHKLLAVFDGIPLVRRAALAALASPIDGRLHVVTGHCAGDIETALAGLDIDIVHNPDFTSGMASSLAAGMAKTREADGTLVLLADMPGLSVEHLTRLMEAFRQEGGRSIVRASTHGRRGNPVILPKAVFDAVVRLQGDIGARHIVETSGLPVIDIDIGEAAAIDVDTPEAVQRAGGILSPS